MPSRKITIGAVACLLVIGIFWWVSRPVSVTVATAEYGSAALYVYASGQVITDEKATVRSKNIARIVRILVKEGDHVTQGEPLVEMYSEDVKAEVAAAAANMESARSEYEFRQIEYTRLQKLYSQEAVSHREFDQAATTLMQA